MNFDRKIGFLFDLDGTLIDNMDYHYQAWQQLLKTLGFNWTLSEIKERFWGKNQEIFTRLFPNRFSPSEIQDLAEEKEKYYIELYKDNINFIPGFTEFYKSAKEKAIGFAIATAAPPICVEFVSKSLQLQDYFEVIIDSEMVKKGKPDPQCYLMAAKALGLNAKDCLVFEDAPVGVAAAEQAGMPAIVITSTHKPEEFNQFSNIVKIIKDYQGLSLTDCLSFLR